MTRLGNMLRGCYNIRSSGMPGAAVSADDNVDIPSIPELKASNEFDVCYDGISILFALVKPPSRPPQFSYQLSAVSYQLLAFSF